MTRLLRRTGDYNGLAEVLRADVSRLTEAGDVARSGMLLGEVLEMHLNRPDEAVEAYRNALSAVPDFRPAVDALSRVHGKQNAWRELVDVLALEGETARDPRMQLDAYLRGALLRADRLAKAEETHGLVEQVAQADPNNLAALLALERLYVDANDRPALASVYGPSGGRVSRIPARASPH